MSDVVASSIFVHQFLQLMLYDYIKEHLEVIQTAVGFMTSGMISYTKDLPEPAGSTIAFFCFDSKLIALFYSCSATLQNAVFFAQGNIF